MQDETRVHVVLELVCKQRCWTHMMLDARASDPHVYVHSVYTQRCVNVGARKVCQHAGVPVQRASRHILSDGLKLV